MKPYSEEYWAYMKRQAKDELIKVFRGIAEQGTRCLYEQIIP
jgi:hypothetical protein